MRKVYVDVTMQVVVNVEEGVDLRDVIDEMDYNFVSGHDEAELYAEGIKDWEVTDSK